MQREDLFNQISCHLKRCAKNRRKSWSLIRILCIIKRGERDERLLIGNGQFWSSFKVLYTWFQWKIHYHKHKKIYSLFARISNLTAKRSPNEMRLLFCSSSSYFSPFCCYYCGRWKTIQANTQFPSLMHDPIPNYRPVGNIFVILSQIGKKN